MKTKIYLTLFLIAASFDIAVAQNIFPANGSVGIGTTSPNASSVLEIKSTTQGVLIPRLTVAKRNAIASPAAGLLIYQTNATPGFYYYNGTAWTAINTPGANSSLSNLSATAVNTNLLPDSSKLRNLGSTGKTWKNIYFSGNLYSGDKRVLYSDNSGNFFTGLNSGTASNGAIWNTAIGNNTFLNNTTGEANTVLGYASLQLNTTGNQNTAVGFGALSSNTSASFNTSVGTSALTSNTTGNENTAVGVQTLQFNSTGALNTAVGAYALLANTTGYINTGVGYDALDSNTIGVGNTALGYYSGIHIKTGSFNTTLGYESGFTNTAGDFENTTAVGAGAGTFVGSSNEGVFGNSSVTQLVAQVGWSQFSDGRVKDNIKSNVPGLAFINKLNPVTYNFNIHRENEMLAKSKQPEKNWAGKYDLEKKKMTGFIAQEVEKAATDVGYDFSGVTKPVSPDGLYALNYSEFVVPLVKAVQELSKMNDAKDSEINNLESRIEKLEAMMNRQTSSAVKNQAVINSKAVATIQNTPNPFSNTTTIRYTLPQKFMSAKMLISDNAGNAVKQINLATGKGSINFNAAGLAAGIYNCSLYVDSNLIAGGQIIKAN